MELTHYFEVSAFDGSESNAPDALALGIQMFHRANTMQSFAIAFPDMERDLTGTRLRVFSSSADHLQALSRFAKSRGLSEVLEFGDIQAVPAHQSVEYFKHFRVKSENKKYLPGKKPSDEYFAEQYKLLRAMPYIWMSSKSSSSKFRSYISRVKQLESSMVVGEPNSYGLSSTRNMVAIPVF